MPFDILEKYLRMEIEVARAELDGDSERAETIRSIMDTLWLQMTNEQHDELNSRTKLE